MTAPDPAMKRADAERLARVRRVLGPDNADQLADTLLADFRAAGRAWRIGVTLAELEAMLDEWHPQDKYEDSP